MIIILTTVASRAAAVKLGNLLLRKKLIACFSFFPLESAYWWKGSVKSSKEFQLILKTKESNFKKIEAIIKTESGYETPEIISVKPNKISKEYLNWLDAEIKEGTLKKS